MRFDLPGCGEEQSGIVDWIGEEYWAAFERRKNNDDAEGSPRAT